jgi:hypothetical protein
MLNDLSAVKKLHLLLSISADILALAILFITLFLPLKTTNKQVRFWGLGVGVVSVKVSFYLLAEINRIEIFINGNQHLEENNYVNNLTLLKNLNDQYYQNQLQPRYLPQNNYQDELVTEGESSPLETNQHNINLFDWENFKNKDEFPNIAVIGKPGSGKSTLGQWLGAMFGGLTVAIAPHYQSGDFPTADLICGKGRNYGTEIEKEPLILFDELLTGKHNLSCLGVIKSVHNEMTRRYQSPDYSNCEAITLILDEYNSYACKKGLSDYIGELLREARKVNIRLIFLCHQTNVKSWGIEGNGDIRKSINQVNLVSHALDLAKTSLNNCKINSNNYYYWLEVIEILKGNKRACLVDDYLAEIPDLTNWLATPKPNQLVLGNQNTAHCTAPTTQSRNTLPLWDCTQDTRDEGETLERVFNLETDTEHCPKCDSINIKNNGKTSAGKPRKRCNDCGVTWSI